MLGGCPYPFFLALSRISDENWFNLKKSIQNYSTNAVISLASAGEVSGIV